MGEIRVLKKMEQQAGRSFEKNKPNENLRAARLDTVSIVSNWISEWRAGKEAESRSTLVFLNRFKTPASGNEAQA